MCASQASCQHDTALCLKSAGRGASPTGQWALPKQHPDQNCQCDQELPVLITAESQMCELARLIDKQKSPGNNRGFLSGSCLTWNAIRPKPEFMTECIAS